MAAKGLSAIAIRRLGSEYLDFNLDFHLRGGAFISAFELGPPVLAHFFKLVEVSGRW